MCRLTVTPLCPPMTGTFTEGARERSPSFSATKVEARTTSRVVTPKSLNRGSARVTRVNKHGHPTVPLRVEDTVFLEDFGDNWNRRVYRVRNHENEGLGTTLGDPGGEITNNTSVDLRGKASQ
jgi:hypothetical protein